MIEEACEICAFPEMNANRYPRARLASVRRGAAGQGWAGYVVEGHGGARSGQVGSGKVWAPSGALVFAYGSAVRGTAGLAGVGNGLAWQGMAPLWAVRLRKAVRHGNERA